MPQPSNSTIRIGDDISFNAMSARVAVATIHDGKGMPQMGTTHCAIDITVDMHDTVGLSYTSLQALFELASNITRDKIKTVKIEYWRDESQSDAICTYTFEGWISNFTTDSGGGSNHTLSLSLQPALDQKSFINIVMGN